VEKLCETFVYNLISFARFTGIVLEYLRFPVSKGMADASSGDGTGRDKGELVQRAGKVSF
jgi:hypothetical protein